ncbi:hypothetical protein P152DRAFT_510654 [Eremomyces bilateralis CBS 781.70]|uniref:Uncharacterized protein n=1 Tax=Eremomyces bilateralis CBS 781.70 TaxID=1392243 RepID=A0A6G1GH34_9PEZI|nr:uncharacterized protein P152DRAFT_510654 [Eremomyces bilateralis CBS 781.70]KAF1817415.1 hypothetical protein P152DRAFT_510654 [Eremomyces bilateralis CBS 781.70]
MGSEPPTIRSDHHQPSGIPELRMFRRLKHRLPSLSCPRTNPWCHSATGCTLSSINFFLRSIRLPCLLAANLIGSFVLHHGLDCELRSLRSAETFPAFERCRNEQDRRSKHKRMDDPSVCRMVAKADGTTD